ncbi:MAG TPA: sugar nucleotide-binding protein, partial [Gemmatimonadaceae bacterium]|nr:sugar nucleotide-binding protein [Gemmatimonadaceae bacterium]
PTSALAVARGIVDVLRSLGVEGSWADAIGDAAGIYHMTADGSTTWHGFAQRILADDPRSPEQVCRAVRSIASVEYPTPARRPAYSVLDNSKLARRFGVRLPHWSDQWSETVAELRINWPLAFPRAAAARRADPPTA